jgi:hypothetical protein
MLFPPIETGRLIDPGFAADLCYRHGAIAQIQNERLPRTRKLQCLHRFCSFSQPGSDSGKLQAKAIPFLRIRPLRRGDWAVTPDAARAGTGREVQESRPNHALAGTPAVE